MERGFCQRCKPFNKCMGLLDLTVAEWKNVEELISDTNDLLNVEKTANLGRLKK